MKKTFWLGSFAGILLLLGTAGCQSEPAVNNGTYAPTRGGEERVVVYNDLIFLHMARPAAMKGTSAWWDWGGKFKVNDSNEMEFEMSEKERKDWNFYYIFRPSEKNEIRVEVLGDPEKSFVFRRRTNPQRTLKPMGN